MIKIDLAGLSEKDVKEVVVRHCSGYGVIKGLRIYPAAMGTLARPFALVDMETTEQAENLAAAFGQRTLGGSVVVILQQEQAAAPAILPTRKQWVSG